ncbi:MAG TPA: DUF1285 domain-containing protein [Alphaproteobacteria bacterium]|nr:DUF1285 domain-containing protein [Alphaproteobacteria bacterium]
MSIDQTPERVYGIRIARDGTWFHEGSPINRIELVKLFASVLRRDEGGDYWLITPAERGRITVEDAPFVAVAVRVEGCGEDQKLVFRTNLDREITAGSDHPIRVETDILSGEPSPYIFLEERIEARISRAVFYELVERAVERPTAQGAEIGIWSDRTFFALGTISLGATGN